MEKRNWEVTIRENPITGFKDIWIFRHWVNSEVEVLQTDMNTVKTFKEGSPIEPTAKISSSIFQKLVDAIHKDFKPSEGKFTEGKLKATEYHLEDLRKLLKLS